MKRFLSILFCVAVVILNLVGCSKNNTSSSPTPPSSSASPSPGGDVSPEMKSFLQEFGTSQKIDAALKKQGIEGLQTQDMEMYDLKDPKILSSEKKGTQTCYTVESKAGITIRTYGMCWENGKIVAIEDKGVK